MACRMCSGVGSGSASTSAAADTICPGVQKPHWSASARTNASTSGWSRSPSIVVTSRSPTVWTSVMHESTGTPSSCTVHAPQWPSPQAIFVPVSPRSSRSVSARELPTDGSGTRYRSPLTLSSSTARHRQDVRQVDEPEGRTARRALVVLVVELGQRPPQVARGLEQPPDLLPLVLVLRAVPLVARVQGQPEHADRVRLARPEQRRRHREVLVDAGELHRLPVGVGPAGGRRVRGGAAPP